MIPKHLKISGFFSYKTATSIDFTPLSKAGLFGIFGKVGSGKSAILEAMMLALYGEVERMSNKQRNYNLMNLESDELLIEFEFEAASKEYRSVVAAKRNKKRFEDVGVYKTTYYEKIENNWKPIENFDIQRVIGLKAEEFKKTIVIPQNTFQEFLKLGETERTRMMRDLFNLEKYDLSLKVKKLVDENDKNLENNKTQLSALGQVNAEIIETQKNQIIDLEKNIHNFKLKIESLRQEEAQLKNLKTQFEYLEQQQAIARQLATQADAMRLKSQQIKDLEYCQTHFKTPLEQLADAQQQLNQTQKILAQKDKTLTIKQNDLSEKNNSLQKLRPEYEGRATLRRQADELESLQKVVKLNDELKALQLRIDKGKNLVESSENEAQKLRQHIKTLQTAREDLQEKVNELAILLQIKNWFSTKNNFLKNIEKISQELITHQEKLYGIETNKKRLVTGVLPLVRLQVSEVLSIAEVIIQVKAHREAGRKQTEQLEHAMQQLHQAKPLATLAATLHEGEPCPLCGSIHHPSVFDEARTQREISDLTKHKKQLQKENTTLENVERELITDKANFNTHQENKKRLQQEREHELAELNLHIEKFLWKNYDSHKEDLIDEKIQQVTASQKKLQQTDQKLKTEQTQLDHVQEDILKYKKRLQDLDIALKGVETTQQNEMQRVQTVENIALWLAETPEKLAQKAKNYRENADNIERDYEQLFKVALQLERDISLLRGGVETLEMQVKEKKEKITIYEERLNQLVIQSHFNNLKEIKNILQYDFDLEKSRNEVKTYEAKRYASEQLVTQLQAQLEDKKFDIGDFNILQQKIIQYENDFNGFNQQLGEAKNKLKDFENRFAQINILQHKREYLEERGKNLDILRGVFKGSAFVNYVSHIYMKNICDIANARFERFTQYRLRLELDKNNNFLICDMLNSGKTRSIQTLSGGQLFQASLALALALADSIQRLTKNTQNFFFLDEGFGSLDNDSLQIVFETLKALRQENRVVGIISHVEAMQQEIEQYLRVWLDEKVGSRVAAAISQY